MDTRRESQPSAWGHRHINFNFGRDVWESTSCGAGLYDFMNFISLLYVHARICMIRYAASLYVGESAGGVSDYPPFGLWLGQTNNEMRCRLDADVPRATLLWCDWFTYTSHVAGYGMIGERWCQGTACGIHAQMLQWHVPHSRQRKQISMF